MLDALTTFLPMRSRRSRGDLSTAGAGTPLPAAGASRTAGPAPDLASAAQDAMRETFELLEADLDHAVAEVECQSVNAAKRSEAMVRQVEAIAHGAQEVAAAAAQASRTVASIANAS